MARVTKPITSEEAIAGRQCCVQGVQVFRFNCVQSILEEKLRGCQDQTSVRSAPFISVSRDGDVQQTCQMTIRSWSNWKHTDLMQHSAKLTGV